MDSRINLSRLRQHMAALAGFGRTANGGISRTSFSREDRNAKAWLTAKIKAAGLHPRIDGPETYGVGWGRRGGPFWQDLILTPSPTVACSMVPWASWPPLNACRPSGTGLQHTLSLEMVAFAEEEGAYLTFMGSRAVAGCLDVKDVQDAKSLSAVPLVETLCACGLSIRTVTSAKRNLRDICAYLELHIEQGPTLAAQQVPIGIVNAIVGIVCYAITFQGDANHAGTTPMASRQDALLGASEFTLRVDDWVRCETTGVATVGKFDVFPGASNIIPGKVCLPLEFRDSSTEKLERIEKSILAIGREVAEKRKLNFVAEKISRDAPVELSPAVIDTLKLTADSLGYAYRMIDSGAGHDAQVMAPKVNTGMIFIPSLGGKSHCPDEESNWSDVEKGTQLLMNTILSLATQEA